MEKMTIGRIDKIDLPEFGLENIEAKIDTGANRSSIHCSKIEHRDFDGVDSIVFSIPLDGNDEETLFHSSDFTTKNIRSSSGHVEERYIIKTTVVIFGKQINTSFSLTDRTEMKFPILLGRKLLANRYIVDVDLTNLSHQLKNNTK
ncbi:RimK/LysX family protein [Reichenbachiella carrageenanivorans]|uniref:RimK/LysX family protein n=1 Tax=Reichenbachiella carrageenanivorans TaxID=2979869 RepID=A0ABY6D2T8_9BACT|nr:RimK/LysX family protein [Reichenbachiella carrageenanivorans]UXX78155.1 RimK/LysX family protein [Reichenbachiella carrageenanivorans]